MRTAEDHVLYYQIVVLIECPFRVVHPHSAQPLFCLQFMFHANLMITGNYGIYNLLSIVISLALLPWSKRRYSMIY